MFLDAPIGEAHNAAVSKEAVGRIVFWGTYDLSKPRSRILLGGLKDIGADVTEIHADIWPVHADKSQMGAGAFITALLRALLWYPVLIFRFLLIPRDAVVVVPYLGTLDVLVLWPFARLRNQRVVWDMFLSLYDTVVNDRQMISERGLLSRVLYSVEWLAARAADLVLLDTRAHAEYVAGLMGLPSNKTGWVPVGAEADCFRRLAPSRARDGRPRVLFYGQLIPLHGIETILKAALSDRGRAIDWHIIGTGQDRYKIDAALNPGSAEHVRHQEWVPYEQLIESIGAADICLGIFGASDKAACVVPNKVYQALLSGRAVITRDSSAMRETFGDGAGLKLVPHSDPEALLDAIDALEAEGFAAMPEKQLAIASPRHVAERFRNVIAPTTSAAG